MRLNTAMVGPGHVPRPLPHEPHPPAGHLLHTYMHACMHTYKHTHMYTSTHPHIHTYIDTESCIHAILYAP